MPKKKIESRRRGYDNCLEQQPTFQEKINCQYCANRLNVEIITTKMSDVIDIPVVYS